MVLSIVITVVCAVALIGLLVAEGTGRDRLKYATKPVASAAFITLAATGGGLHSGPPGYAAWVLVGLVFAAGGDVALMLPQRPAFLVGLVLFLVGHIAYVVAAGQVVAPSAWLAPPVIALAVAAAVVLAWLWRHLDRMKLPVILYVATISVMVAAATSAWRVGVAGRLGLDDRQAVLLALGALLFYLSDLAVARQRFVAQGFVNRAWGLPAYYAGQLLLAWSTIS